MQPPRPHLCLPAESSGVGRTFQCPDDTGDQPGWEPLQRTDCGTRQRAGSGGRNAGRRGGGVLSDLSGQGHSLGTALGTQASRTGGERVALPAVTAMHLEAPCGLGRWPLLAQ